MCERPLMGWDSPCRVHFSLLNRYELLSTPGHEARLLSTVLDLYRSGTLPEALEYITTDHVRFMDQEGASYLITLHT